MVRDIQHNIEATYGSLGDQGKFVDFQVMRTYEPLFLVVVLLLVLHAKRLLDVSGWASPATRNDLSCMAAVSYVTLYATLPDCQTRKHPKQRYRLDYASCILISLTFWYSSLKDYND